MSGFKIDIPAAKSDERVIRRLKDEKLPVVLLGAGEVAETFKAKLEAAGIPEVYCAVSGGFGKPEGAYFPEEIDAKLPAYNLVPAFREALLYMFGNMSGKLEDQYRAFHHKKSVNFLMNFYEGSGIEEISADFFREHYDDYKRLYDSLADEKSKESYTAYLQTKLSENYSGVACLAELPMYFSSSFIRLGADEVFVDCGAYDGDTIKDFFDCVNYARWGG